MGVSTDGDVALCHRFAGSDDHTLGNVRDGVSFEKQQDFLQSHHIAEQDRLRDLLGAADLRRRLLSRSAHALRLDQPSQPALLRMDSRLDAHLSRDLR